MHIRFESGGTLQVRYLKKWQAEKVIVLFAGKSVGCQVSLGNHLEILKVTQKQRKIISSYLLKKSRN
jgi:hypothetical protein